MALQILGALAKAASAAKAAQGVVDSESGGAAKGAKEGATLGTALANPASALAGSTEDTFKSKAFGKSFDTDRGQSQFDDALKPMKR